MTRSDSGGDHRGPRIAAIIEGDLQPCWLCGRSVAARALFCHACGAVQPPRPLDHFSRLGMERRFDIDLEMLAKQRAGLSRALDPERFTARGARQQALARQQAEALDAAYEVLHDPVRRARYLLELNGDSPLMLDAADPETTALKAELAAATDAVAVDRLGAQVTRRIAGCIKDLATAFRGGATDLAAATLSRLEALESIAAEARAKRAGLTP